MSVQWRTRRSLGALAASLLTAALVTAPGAGTASAASCELWTGVPPPSPGATENELDGMRALGPCNVWAVGFYQNVANGQILSLAEHWNGTAWKAVPTPNPGTSSNFLRAVSAFSASNVWAVGNADNNTLILHWNGTAWAQMPSPSPGAGGNFLNGVDVVSATSAWAVGEVSDASFTQKTLILRWNGTKWSQVPSPAPGTDSRLDAVTVTSASYAWAVGSFSTGTTGKTLILHWNGTKWVQAVSPNPSGTVTEMDLAGAAATSASNAWAVGTYNTSTSTSQNIIIERWNGTAWKLVPSPDPGPEPFLFGVAAASASDAWAVGSYDAGASQNTMIAHWNGAAWKLVPSPSPGSSASFLRAVTATSASNVWAAGDFSNGGPSQVFAIHCC
jgi:hypothetical protein